MTSEPVMKRYFLLIVCAIACTLCDAQIRLGIKGGVNLSNLAGAPGQGYTTKMSFYGGGLANVPLIRRISLQAELLYSRQGSRYQETGRDMKERLNYLNAPVLVHYNTTIGLYAETGPQFGFLINAKRESDGHYYSVRGAYRSFDFSWLLGAGYRLTEEASVGIRWNIGISDVSDYPGAVRNRVWQIGVAYTLATVH